MTTCARHRFTTRLNRVDEAPEPFRRALSGLPRLAEVLLAAEIMNSLSLIGRR